MVRMAAGWIGWIEKAHPERVRGMERVVHPERVRGNSVITRTTPMILIP